MAGADPAQFANMPTTGSETDQLFERIQRVCGNPITYHSFLKLVNAFNQNIIDMATMMERAKYFIGRDKQLFDDFKAVLSYSDPYPEPAPLESNVRNADFPESRVRGGESPRRVHPITAAERNDPGPSYRMVSKVRSRDIPGILLDITNNDDDDDELLLFFSQKLHSARELMPFAGKSLMTNTYHILRGLVKMAGLWRPRRTSLRKFCTGLKRSDTLVILILTLVWQPLHCLNGSLKLLKVYRQKNGKIIARRHA